MSPPVSPPEGRRRGAESLESAECLPIVYRIWPGLTRPSTKTTTWMPGTSPGMTVLINARDEARRRLAVSRVSRESAFEHPLLVCHAAQLKTELQAQQQ